MGDAKVAASREEGAAEEPRPQRPPIKSDQPRKGPQKGAQWSWEWLCLQWPKRKTLLLGGAADRVLRKALPLQVSLEAALSRQVTPPKGD